MWAAFALMAGSGSAMLLPHSAAPTLIARSSAVGQPALSFIARSSVVSMVAGDDSEERPPTPSPADDAGEASAETAKELASAAADEEQWRLPHVDESAHFDDEDVPDDQMMADWRDVRRLNRLL